MDENIKKFSRSLNKLCAEKGTAARLSQALGISESAISNYRAGYGGLPRTHRLMRIANFFGVSVDKLLGLK